MSDIHAGNSNIRHEGNILGGGYGIYGDQSFTGSTHIGHNIHLNESSLQSSERERSACLAALFLTDPIDDRAKLITEKGRRTDGTCEWIKSHREYLSWRDFQTRSLWIFGGPGKGKTMLSIYLTEELEEVVKESHGALLTYYFCDNRDGNRNTAIAILRGLILQLLHQRLELFKHILPVFKVQKNNLFSNSSFESLWRIFESMIRDPANDVVYCVLDGLDECEERSLEVLTENIGLLFSAVRNNSLANRLHLIAVSRTLPDCLPGNFSKFPRIKVDTLSDLEQFISDRVNKLCCQNKYPPGLSEHVRERLIEGAEGTFLWIAFVVRELRYKKSSEVRKTLECLPKGLYGMYERMLNQIHEERRADAWQVLRWVVMAVRPMTVTELSVATDATPPPGLSRDIVMREQVEFCGDFLTIKDSRVRLVHASAKEYLLRFHIRAEEANLEIANRCLAYIRGDAFKDGLAQLFETHHSPARLQEYPLISYAANNLPYHTRGLPDTAQILSDIETFFYKEEQLRKAWIQSYWRVREYTELPGSFTLLHLASYCGIDPLVKNLLDHRRQSPTKKRLKSRSYFPIAIDCEDSYGETPLSYAVRKGYEAVVQLLLKNGAKVNKAVSILGNTVLEIAASLGNEGMVQLLLKNGPDVNKVDNIGETPLHNAVRSRNEGIMQLLLKNGAGVNKVNDIGETALHNAARGRNEGIMQILLKNGADVNKVGGIGGETALHEAASHGCEAVVQLLLQNGAKINKIDNKGETALHHAARSRNEAIMQLLLKNGAEINKVNNIGGTPLHNAVRSRNEGIMQLLLKNGADVNMANSRGETALHHAVSFFFSYQGMVQLLIKNGADVNKVNCYGETALHHAVSYRSKATVQLLLKNGADVNKVNHQDVLRFTDINA